MKDPWAGYSKKDEEHLKKETKWAEQNFKILSDMEILFIGQKILDVGCSHGFFLENCNEYLFESYGIDIDPSVIDGKKIRKCNVEKDRFPFKKDTFDVVFSSGLLQHLSKPPVNFMEESRRVLKKNGCLVVHVRNEKSWINLLISQYDNFRHKSTWSAHSLRQMFEYYGFEVIFLEPKFLGKKWMRKFPFKYHIGSNLIIVGVKK